MACSFFKLNFLERYDASDTESWLVGRSLRDLLMDVLVQLSGGGREVLSDLDGNARQERTRR